MLRKQRMEDFSYILWGDGARGGGRDKQKAREKIAEQRIWGRIFAERLERDRENFLLGKQKDLFKSKK